MPDTVLGVFEATAARQPDRPAMRTRSGGEWRTTVWTQYREEVRRAARGLIARGVQPGEGVAILGYNRPEWFVANVAAIAAGARPAGIYTTSTAEQCRYIVSHAEVAVAVVENREGLAKLAASGDQLSRLKAIVLMEGAAQDPRAIAWEAFLASGDGVAEAELDRRIAPQRTDDVCTLIYTSGTTGPPKAVMLTHRNITFISARMEEFIGVQPTDRLISYLPLSHVAEQIVSHHLSMRTGACVHFAESLERLGDDLREVRPHLFLGVPRVWEKVQAAMQAAGAQASPLRRRIAAWARRVGLEGGYATQQGRPRPWSWGLADRLVFSKVRERLGLDQLRMAVVSAAPIAVETLDYFLSLGIPIMEVYGMSECCGPTTMSLPARYRTGRAGCAVPGTEVELAEDGEVLIRGPHVFKGYYKDEAATSEALDTDGWIHSGDIGEIDSDGFLRITDRKKELIITSGGKNVAPQLLEGKLRQIPAVSQAVAIGDRRAYVVALLTLDPARVAAEAEKAGSPARTSEEAAACPVFKAHLDRQVEVVNSGLARFETVKKVLLLPSELTIDGGELTPTLKLKRRVIHEKYRREIESLYA
jgi:long-subunit acyl-CoA synthetase (AMP-forming)